MESGIYLRPFEAQVKQNWLVCHCQVMSARSWPVLFGRSRWCWCGGHRGCPCCRRQDSDEMPPLKSNCNQWRPGWFQRDGQGQVSKRKVSNCWQWGLSNAPESNGTANAMRLEEEVGQNGFRGAKTRSRRDAPEVTVATRHVHGESHWWISNTRSGFPGWEVIRCKFWTKALRFRVRTCQFSRTVPRNHKSNWGLLKLKWKKVGWSAIVRFVWQRSNSMLMTEMSVRVVMVTQAICVLFGYQVHPSGTIYNSHCEQTNSSLPSLSKPISEDVLQICAIELSACIQLILLKFYKLQVFEVGKLTTCRLERKRVSHCHAFEPKLTKSTTLGRRIMLLNLCLWGVLAKFEQLQKPRHFSTAIFPGCCASIQHVDGLKECRKMTRGQNCGVGSTGDISLKILPLWNLRFKRQTMETVTQKEMGVLGKSYFSC